MQRSEQLINHTIYTIYKKIILYLGYYVNYIV